MKSLLNSTNTLLTPNKNSRPINKPDNKLLNVIKNPHYLNKQSEYFKIDNNLSEIDTESERLAARKNLGIEAGETEWGKINGYLEDQIDLMDYINILQGKINLNKELIEELAYRNSLNIYKVLPDVESLYNLDKIKEGAIYSVGPDSENKYKIFVHVDDKWVYMGYLNSSHIDVTQEIGTSENLVMSQKAIKDNFISSTSIRNIDTSHTQKEIEQMIKNETIDPHTLYLAFESNE